MMKNVFNSLIERSEFVSICPVCNKRVSLLIRIPQPFAGELREHDIMLYVHKKPVKQYEILSFEGCFVINERIEA